MSLRVGLLSVFCWRERAVCFHSERLRAPLAFSLSLVPVQTRSSFWYDKHLLLAQTTAEPLWQTHLIQSHSHTHSQSNSIPPLLFCLSFSHCQTPLKQTLSRLSRKVSAYHALGFFSFFFVGWGNDMVVALAAVRVKQQIRLATAPFCLFNVEWWSVCCHLEVCHHH